jgi:protease I
MSTALLIITQRNFNETEYMTTKNVLIKEKIKVETASITTEECIGMKGLRVKPDKAVIDALKKEYDAVILIGGSGCYELSNYPEVNEIVKRQAEKSKVLAAICLAPVILAKAGVLEDVLATVFPEDWAVTLLQQYKAHYMARDVIADGNIITADGPKSAEKFAKTILKKLKS